MPAKASAADAVVPDPAPEVPQAEQVAPQPPPETAAPQPESDGPAAPEWGNWLYTGPADRIYTNVPVTPEPGDVVTWLGPPATDGFWEPTDAEATRHPDNHRPEPTEAPKEG